MGGDIDKGKKEAEILTQLGSIRGKLFLLDIYVEEEKFELAEKEFENYHENFKEFKDNYIFYNSYGYFLIRQKKYDKAIIMFKKQVNLAPTDENTYDSLGDGYKAAGKLEQALASYKKAVEINPKFESSVKNVKKLEEKLKE